MTPQKNEFAGPVSKKAFEVAHAVLKVAAYSGNDAFKSYMEGYAMLLMDGIARGDKEASGKALQAIRQFMPLGTVAGLLNQQDADLLDNEANALNAAIAESGNSALPESVIAGLFTKSEPAKVKHNTATRAVAALASTGSASIVAEEKKEERHRKLIERIRQSGNCRMKDLQDYLPNISERTLRYDLQELVASGKIERGGAGGPSVHYSISNAEKVTAPSVPVATPVTEAATEKAPLWEE